MAIILTLISLLVSCIPADTAPADVANEIHSSIFTNKWWEVVSGPPVDEIYDACFMLHEVDYDGGTLIKFEEGEEWPYFSYQSKWEYTEDEDIYLIEGEYEVEITQKGNRCWNIEYSIYDAVVCTCSLDTTAVAPYLEWAASTSESSEET